MVQDTPLLTTGGAAKLLGLSVEMVRKLSRTGKLAATRTSNGSRVFDRSAVEALLRARKQQKKDRAHVA